MKKGNSSFVGKERNNNLKEKINEYKNNKKFITIGLILLFIIFFSIFFALLNINNSKILDGVYVNGIDLSNMSKEEAREKLETLINDKKTKEITVTYEEYQSTINPKVLEVNYDLNSAIENAYAVGRSGNLIANNYTILITKLFNKNVDIEVTTNEQATEKAIKDLGTNLPGALVQSGYYIENNQLVLTKGTSGVVINTVALKDNINSIYKDLTQSEYSIEIPVENKEPDTIDIDKIHNEIYKEAKDAYYKEDPLQIYPEVEGVDFDVAAAKNLLGQEQEECVIDLVITKPAVTINDLGEVAFKDKLSTFTTKYDVSNVSRTTNLKLATDKINGTVLAPGEEFSYNKVVGERTIEAGYKEAKVYSNGQVVDGLGGGICQISSTLYNTVVLANLEVTDRRNHQFVTSYVPAGRDATVVYGSQDFKFKNTRKYPVKIEATVNNGIVEISLLGIKEDEEYDISFQVNTISTIPATTEYKEDSSLLAGEEKVEQKGANGLVTETYKIVKSKGAVVSKTLLSKDTYNAMPKIVLRGSN